MADRSIIIRIGANVTDLVSKLKTAETATGQWVNKNKAAINTVSLASAAIGGALVSGVALAVKKFADFDQAMSAVQAATMETSANMGVLREAALQAGADTMYTASEAAAAMTDLAKAGVSTADILKGGLAGSLNLAAAAQMGVADAAEATATAMNQFGLKGSDATHISDLLAAAAGKAMGEVSDMAGALKFVGPIAHQMGVSIEETTGTIAELARQGIVGEQAGTSLRGMLMALTSPSKIASQEMLNLGINVYGANGKFIGLAGVAQQLQDTMGNLTNAERDEAFGRIFGNEQITTARILYAGGAADVKKWTDAVNASGYASEQARIKTDNLKGDIERLGGSLDTVFIQAGSGANDALRTMTQSAEGFVNEIGKIPEPILGVTTLIAGTGGMAALAVAGIGKIATTVNTAKIAIETLGMSFRAVSLAAAGVGTVIGVATFAFAAWLGEQQKAKQYVDDLTRALDQQTGAIGENVRARVGSKLEEQGTIDRAKSLGIALNDLVDASIDPSSAAMRRLQQASQDATAAWRASQQSDVNSGMGMQMSQQTRDAEAAVQSWNVVLGAVGGSQDAVAKSQQRWRDQQEMGIATTEDATSAQKDNRTTLEKLRESTDSAAGSTTDYVKALKDLIDAQAALAGNAISEAEAQIRFQQAIDDASASLKDNGRTLDINTEAGRKNKTALLDVADAGWKVIESMQANGASQDALQASMTTTRQAFIDAAVQMGMGKDAAAALADQLNLIPQNVYMTVTADTSQADKELQAFLDRVASKHPVIVPTLGDVVIRAGQMGRFAEGGRIAGAGTGTSDSILARVSNGEYIVNAASTARHLGALQAINADKYANGGYVGPEFTRVPGYAGGGPVPPSSSSLVGVAIVGTLDTPWGPSQLRGVVREEIADASRAAAGNRQTPGRRSM